MILKLKILIKFIIYYIINLLIKPSKDIRSKTLLLIRLDANLDSLHIVTKKDISNFKLKILKFTKSGLHKLLQKRFKSKTWDDYLKVSKL